MNNSEILYFVDFARQPSWLNFAAAVQGRKLLYRGSLALSYPESTPRHLLMHPKIKEASP